MFKYFYTAFAIMGILANWSKKALADGKVTADEAFSLIVQLAGALGLPIEFSLPDLAAQIAKKGGTTA